VTRLAKGERGGEFELVEQGKEGGRERLLTKIKNKNKIKAFSFCLNNNNIITSSSSTLEFRADAIAMN